MNSFFNPLARPSCPASFSSRIAEIKAWTRAALGLGDDIVVSVNELACGQADCPPQQVVILILPEGAPARKFVVHNRLLDLREGDIIAAIEQSGDW